eukprot:g12647.t1
MSSSGRSGHIHSSLSRGHGHDYAGPGAGACTAIVHVFAYSALALSSKFVLDDLRFPYPLFLAAVWSLGAPWLCLVSGQTADVEEDGGRTTGTKLKTSVGGILLDGIVGALVTGLATTGLLFLDPISWCVVMANLPVFHVAMTISTRNAKRILLVCRAGAGPRRGVAGATAGAADQLHQRNLTTIMIIEREHSKGAKWARLTEPVQIFCIVFGAVGSVSSYAYGSYDFVASSRTASALDVPVRGVPLAAFGILFCVPALVVASLRDVLQMQEAEHDEDVEVEPARSARALGAGAPGAVRKSVEAVASSHGKGEVDSREQPDVADDEKSDADHNSGDFSTAAFIAATYTGAAKQQLFLRIKNSWFCYGQGC